MNIREESVTVDVSIQGTERKEWQFSNIPYALEVPFMLKAGTDCSAVLPLKKFWKVTTAVSTTVHRSSIGQRPPPKFVWISDPQSVTSSHKEADPATADGWSFCASIIVRFCPA
jgi:hypothetical protein